MNNPYKNFFSIILYTILAIIGSNGIAILLAHFTVYISIITVFIASCLAIPLGIINYIRFKDTIFAGVIFFTGVFNVALWIYIFSLMAIF